MEKRVIIDVTNLYKKYCEKVKPTDEATFRSQVRVIVGEHILKEKGKREKEE